MINFCTFFVGKVVTIFIDMYLYNFSVECRPEFFEVLPFIWHIVFVHVN